MYDTFLVWYLLVLPSDTQAVTNMTSLRTIDGDTSYKSCESFSLVLMFGKYTGLGKENLAKLSEESSIWADELCIGYLGQWATVRRENSNMLGSFFLHNRGAIQ